MTPYPHPILAREGWPFIALATGAALATTVLAGPWWSLPLWIVALFVVLPVSFIITGGVLSVVLGHSLRKEGEYRHEGSELIETNV